MADTSVPAFVLVPFRAFFFLVPLGGDLASLLLLLSYPGGWADFGAVSPFGLLLLLLLLFLAPLGPCPFFPLAFRLAPWADRA